MGNKKKALKRSAYWPLILSIMYGALNRLVVGVAVLPEYPFVGVGRPRPLIEGVILLAIGVGVSLAYELDFLKPGQVDDLPSQSTIERLTARLAGLLLARTTNYEVRPIEDTKADTVDSRPSGERNDDQRTHRDEKGTN